jgi:hypothetical protein
MALAWTAAPREGRWLKGRLEGITPSLPVYRYTGPGRGKHIIYGRQGGTDIDNLSGTYMVRSVWIVYISQPVNEGETFYIEDLAADADRMHEAIYKPQEIAAVDGRYIEECRRDFEHEMAVYDDEGTLAELQLGGSYIILTTLEQ